MFDSVGAFTKQFTPVDGGYLIYPSLKSGGKLVTGEEYERLFADWERIAGRSGRWKAAGLVMVGILIWTVLAQTLSIPDWTSTFVIAALVAALSGWLLRASFAPRRLVKDRPAVTPPRASSEARRAARAALNWPFVAFALVLSAATFISTLTSSERTLGTWAWLIGSGLMTIAYLWIGLRKLLD